VTRVTSRASLQAQLPGGHSLTASYQNSGFDRQFLLTLGGPILRRNDLSAPVAPGGRRTASLPGRIVGHLYQDTDNDRRFDPRADVPLGGIRLFLDGSLPAVTDDQGFYRYDRVPPGPHRLQVDFETVRADLTALGSLEPSLHLPARVELSQDFGFVLTGAAVGLVWFDANGNGVFDLGENPASDVRILCSCGRDTLTNSDGGFILGDMLPGRVALSVDIRTLPPLYGLDPNHLEVEVVAGRQTQGLRLALRPLERPVEELSLATASITPDR
jgi:hypothetical protein